MAVAAHRLPGPAARILIVEDEQLLRAGIKLSLARFGYEVEEAASGEEALERLRARAADLVLLDIHLPGLEGVELMERICRLCPGIKLIILTGQPDLESAIGAIKCRALDYLIKPVDLDELLSAVRRALQSGGIASERDEPAKKVLDLGGLLLDREAQRAVICTADGRQIAVTLSPSEVSL
ncbi:MAG: response regulator, partial [Anaerolineae bacterium]